MTFLKRFSLIFMFVMMPPAFSDSWKIKEKKHKEVLDSLQHQEDNNQKEIDEEKNNSSILIYVGIPVLILLIGLWYPRY